MPIARKGGCVDSRCMSAQPAQRPRPRRFALDLPLDLASPAAARRAVATALRQWGVAEDDVLASCAIVVSELVTNALCHTDDDGGTALLEVELAGATLLIAVTDGSPVVPSMREADDAATSGRGLCIVDQLSLRWGSEAVAHGKRVFAVLPAHLERARPLAAADGLTA